MVSGNCRVVQYLYGVVMRVRAGIICIIGKCDCGQSKNLVLAFEN